MPRMPTSAARTSGPAHLVCTYASISGRPMTAKLKRARHDFAYLTYFAVESPTRMGTMAELVLGTVSAQTHSHCSQQAQKPADTKSASFVPGSLVHYDHQARTCEGRQRRGAVPSPWASARPKNCGHGHPRAWLDQSVERAWSVCHRAGSTA